MANSNILFITSRLNETVRLELDVDKNTAYSTAGELHGTLEFDGSEGRLMYKPNKDFTGKVKFTLQYYKKGVEARVDVEIEVANIFRPRARIIKIIGQELISSDVIALVELIKNSYDADSEEVVIELNNVFENDGEIVVTDKGIGMPFEKIVNVWLEPATPDKKATNSQTFSPYFKRRYLGEKGIGRFAVHRLGEKIELVTRAKLDNNTLLAYETKITIDWSDFGEDKYLADIPIKIEKIAKPETFLDSSGTKITITSIQPWKNVKAIRDAAIKIRSLESPVKPQKVPLHKNEFTNDPGMKIELKSRNIEISKAFNEVKSLKELLETSFYKFTGIVDGAGNLVYSYSFNRPDVKDLQRSEDLKMEYLPSLDAEWFEGHPLSIFNSPGEFEVTFHAWDLEASTLRIAGLADYYKNSIKPNAGVRIYRDNFRVWPYGEPDDDWLGLDLKRLNTPKERPVSRNQVFGIVHISSIKNDKLKDQSNREGLIFNEQYEQFQRLVMGALSVFAKERKSDKVKIDKVSISKSVTDVVTASIDKLRRKVESNNHAEYYLDSLEEIETSYKEKINDVLERYMMAAAIGISYSIPIHEMKLRLTSIKSVLDDLNEHPELLDKFLRKLTDYVQETDNIIKAVSSMMSRQKKQRVNLYNVAKNVQLIKDSELKKYNIDLQIIGDDELSVEAVPGLLNTAILNLLDNAIYWLRAKKINTSSSGENFVAQVIISIEKNSEGRSVFKIKDNGDGLQDPFELLLEPYYSRKSDGLGLGLFLVKEIMSRAGGKVLGYNNKGAVIELIF